MKAIDNKISQNNNYIDYVKTRLEDIEENLDTQAIKTLSDYEKSNKDWYKTMQEKTNILNKINKLNSAKELLKKDGKSSERIDNKINLLKLEAQEINLKLKITRFNKYRDGLSTKEAENKEFSNAKSLFTKNVKDFKNKTATKYESYLDKKHRELDESLKIGQQPVQDSMDVFYLMVFGELKLMLDFLRIAEDLGKIITVNYIKNAYDLSAKEAQQIEVMFKEIKELEAQQSILIEKGIIVNDSDIDKDMQDEIAEKRGKIFDISKNLNDEMLKMMDNKEEIIELIDTYKEKEKTIDKSMDSFIKERINSVLFKNQFENKKTNKKENYDDNQATSEVRQ